MEATHFFILVHSGGAEEIVAQCDLPIGSISGGNGHFLKIAGREFWIVSVLTDLGALLGGQLVVPSVEVRMKAFDSGEE